MALVVASALAAYAFVPGRYTARADVWLDHGFDEAGGTARPSRAVGPDPVARNTEMRVLNSADIASDVVDKLGLAHVRGIGQPSDGPRLADDAARARAIANLRDDVAVDATGSSYAVIVRYAAAEPLVAAGILNRLVDSYVEDRRIGGPRGRAREALRSQVAAARDDALRKDAAAAGYRSAADLVRKRGDDALIRQEVSALEAQLKTARAEEAAAEARLGPVKAAGETNAREMTSTAIRELRARRAQQMAARAANGVSGPLRPQSSSVDATLADTDRKLAVETRRAKLVADLREARARTALIEAARARAKAELGATAAATAQLARLDRDALAAREAQAALVRRYAELTAAQRASPGTAYVIAHARVPAGRDFPDLAAFILGGLLAALLAAAIVVIVREMLEDGFRSRHDLERKLGLPVIGMVPDLARVRDADIASDDPMGPPDYLFTHSRSEFAGAFRSIHTGLRLGGSARSPRSVAVCSALAGDGKTTVSICLARSAALAGLRVVLVDCDARRQTASKALTPLVEVGLAEVLEDGAGFKEALQRDTPSGAWFLPFRPDRVVANGAVNSPAMAALIAKLALEYDLIVLDTAPALALVEAREAAALADSVLLVARWRKTPVGAARIAKELLARSGAEVTAAALTLVEA